LSAGGATAGVAGALADGDPVATGEATATAGTFVFAIAFDAAGAWEIDGGRFCVAPADFAVGSVDGG
jgi:hypothetical protein